MTLDSGGSHFGDKLMCSGSYIGNFVPRGSLCSDSIFGGNHVYHI